MTHKTIINICLTLIALCWTVAIQARDVTVDGINYYFSYSSKTAQVTVSNVTGDIVIPEKITVDGVEYPVTMINYGAFKDCKALTSVKIPSLTRIANDVFRGCSSLSSVDMPLVTSIGDNAFYGCSSLASVDMPLVASIGDYAFYGCSSLASVDMPSVTSIGIYAFGCCLSFISVDMPLVTSIGNYAFYSCSSLASVDMPSVTNIDIYAFQACSSLTSVDMPLVTSIGDYAFSACPIANLSLPTTLTSIGNECFTETQEITLAATTPAALGTSVFGRNAVIRVPESAVNDYRTAAGWSNYENQILSMSDITDYDVTVTAQEKESGLHNMITEDNLSKVVSLKVTGTINGYDIMVIRNKMPNLHYLDLTDATIVANNYYYYLNCYTKDNVIGAFMFYDLEKFISVKLPKNATLIELKALGNCTNLAEVVLPVKLERIEGAAFINCKNVTNVDLPPTLKTIGNDAFCGCSLKKISLPGVESIGGSAFECSTLAEVRIPSTLKSIGDNAFRCEKLKKVYTYTVEPINIGQNTFDKTTYETGSLYIPKQSKNNYYWNTQWSQFAKLEEFDEPYKYFYLNKEYTLDDRFTGEPDIDINPGGGIIVPDKPELPDQDADTIHIKGDGKNWASIIANANLNAKGLYIDITIKANRWYFFSFPFKVRKADISCGKNVKFVFRTYNGDIRAKYGKGGWIDLDSSEEFLDPGKGYIFQASLDCTLSIKIEKNEFGKLPKVDVDTKLNIHTSTNEQNASWNFVGNPFTAFYDINDMGYKSPITRWNSDSNTYEAVRPGDDNAFLNPFEAFFVQCPKDNDDINFGGDNRLTQTGRDKKMNSQMQKARMEGQFDVQRQIVNLTLSDGTTTDKTRVVFNPDKKAGYERDCDAAKFESNGASELYSVEALAGRLAINERPEGSVKIGYRAAKAGEYTIAAQRMDRQVLLRDNDLQITFDLTQGDYHFTSDAGEFDNRFMLLIDNSTTGIGDIVTTTGVNVKPTDSGLNISNLQGKTLHVYALNGALYATRTQDGFLGLAKGVYLVEVEGLKAKFMVR